MTKQLAAGTHLYCEYIAPPAKPTVLPIISFTFSPASTTTPAPSLPTCIDSSILCFIAPIRAGCIFIVVIVSSSDPDVLIDEISAAKLKRSPRSDGLIGAASIFISTSSADGVGTFEVFIDSSMFPSLVTSERISLEFVIVSPI